MNKGDLKRAFLAIRIAPSQGAALAGVAASMPENWYKVSPEDYHISLAFLNAVSAKQQPYLSALLRTFAQSARPFDLQFKGLGYFHGRERQGRNDGERMIVYAKPDALSNKMLHGILSELFHTVLRPHGYPVGRHNVVPHNTLAKIHFTQDSDDLQKVRRVIDKHQALATMPAQCAGFALLESIEFGDSRHPARNGGQGSKYRVIEEFNFGPAAENFDYGLKAA